MVNFEVRRDGTVEDAVYDVDPLSDTANPFGDYAVVKIDDRGGEKFGKYSRGTALEVTINDDGQTFDRFDGYVVEVRETEQSGADALEVEAYTFDQFLRRNTVSNDQTGNTIAEALESIVKNDTPVSYVASNIQVSDPQELTRSYRGEPVEVVLRDLAFKSGNEAFGVNDSREFFFRPRETKHIDRGIDNTQWFNYDIPELGKDAINEVEVFFNDGNESVVIDAPTDKLELQDGLSLPEPGTQREELNRPLVTDIQDAEDIGRQYLQFRNATLSGTVTTFGLYDAEPGDTINITIESRGIDTEFRIAAVEYRWGRDETILTVVERRGDQDKILSRISESVKRQEMETADRDAPSNRITTTEANAIVDVSLDADGNTPDDTRFVNPGRNAVRDAWAGDGNPDISFIAIGTDGSGLSRSNTDLNNQVASASATESLPTTTSAEYSASINQTGVEEIGLTTSGGTLIARAVFDTPVDLSGTVSVTLEVSNDNSVQRGVLTNDGQTAVRDVLADNAPNLPTEYAFGSDGSAVSVSDTALGNQQVVDDLSESQITTADTNGEFSDILPAIPDIKPVAVRNGNIELLQANFALEAENGITGGGALLFTQSNLSGGEGIGITDTVDSNGDTSVDSVTVSFTNDYLIESTNLELQMRFDATNGTHPGFEITVDGEVFGSVSEDAFQSGVQWFDFTPSNPSALDPGEHEITITATSDGSSELIVDLFSIYDNRYSYTFDNTTDANDALSGPESYPELVTQSFSTASTRRDVTEATVTQSWTDTSNNQFVETRIGGDIFTRNNNSQTVTHTGGPDTSIDVNIGLSRFTTDSTTTPTNGDTGQVVQSHELTANPSAVVDDAIGATNTRAVIAPGTITGTTIREAGLKSGSVLLTHHELAGFTVKSGQRLASSETTRFKGTE